MAYVIQIEIDADLAKKGSKDAVKSIRAVGTSSEKADKHVSKMEKSMKRAGAAMKVMAVAGAAVAAAALVKLTKDSIAAFIEQERVVSQLEAALKSTGGSAGVTAAELQAMASALQKVTTFGDEATIAMQGVLLTFSNIGKEIFGQTTEAVLDLATAMKMDLQSAAVMIGKALNDPVKGLSAMSRAGITFSASQTQMVKDLVASGKQLEAQKMILKELEKQFGGSAKAARNTLGGALKALSNSFGDLEEAIGGVLSKSAGIQELAEKFTVAIDAMTEGITLFGNSSIFIMAMVRISILEMVSDTAKSIGKLLEKLINLSDAYQKLSKLVPDSFLPPIGDIRVLVDNLKDIVIESDLAAAGLANFAKMDIDEALGNAAEAAGDLAGNLSDAGEAAETLGSIPGMAGFLSGAAAELDRFLELFGKGLSEEMLAAIKAFSEHEVQMIVDVEVGNITTTTGDQRLLGGDDKGGGADLAGSLSELSTIFDGMTGAVLQMSASFVRLSAAMKEGNATASDWITLVIAIVAKIISIDKKNQKRRKQIQNAEQAALFELDKSMDDLNRAVGEVSHKWEKIINDLQAGLELAIKQNEDLAVRDQKIADIERANQQWALEHARAIQDITSRSLSATISLLENLSLYIDDQRLSDDLARLRMEFEIINLRIQLEIVRQLGVVSAEVLEFLEKTIDTVEAGMRNGEIDVGGNQGVGGGGGRRRRRGPGPPPEPELPNALDLLENIYQATGDLEALAELEAIRFEIERANMLAQIDLLLASGTLTDDMADRLRQARADLEGFDPDAITEVVDYFGDAMDALRGFLDTGKSDAQELWDAWAAANKAALQTSTTFDELQGKLTEAFEVAAEAAQQIALSMIDSLVQVVGSEQDIKDLAILRHKLEVAQYRMQLQLLKPFLDADTFALLERLIEDFANMDPTAGLGGTGSGGIPGAIDDQTDRLEAALARLGDLMGDLMTGSLSPLTPEQQYQYALEQYNRLQALARGGDIAAMEALPDAVNALLGSAVAFFGGTATTAYSALFAQVMGDLSAITGLPNPINGMSFPGQDGTASGEIIGSFQDFRDQAESNGSTAHEDSEELKQEFRTLGDKLDLVLAQLPATGTG